MPRIQIEIRNVYGEMKAYPVCDAARHFADIAGTKTLTRRVLARILAIGFSIEVRERFGSHVFFPSDAARLPATI